METENTKESRKDEVRLYGYTSEARSKREFSDEDMVAALKTAQPNPKESLTRQQYQDFYEAHSREYPHPYTIIRRFGKWNDALVRAGLPNQKRAPYRNRVKSEDCIAALRLARQELGYFPSVGEYQGIWRKSLKDEGYPSEGTIRLRFGTWRKALKELDDEDSGSERGESE